MNTRWSLFIVISPEDCVFRHRSGTEYLFVQVRAVILEPRCQNVCLKGSNITTKPGRRQVRTVSARCFVGIIELTKSHNNAAQHQIALNKPIYATRHILDLLYENIYIFIYIYIYIYVTCVWTPNNVFYMVFFLSQIFP